MTIVCDYGYKDNDGARGTSHGDICGDCSCYDSCDFDAAAADYGHVSRDGCDDGDGCSDFYGDIDDNSYGDSDACSHGYHNIDAIYDVGENGVCGNCFVDDDYNDYGHLMTEVWDRG
ncbi:hypothetical protein PoB_007485700 [Plakobranchus ocellatus]|uniref:Uncharacterized protein n=1 Tax=Plakobranchus ocellatus TaxID=259542 RepID=A0AAV4DWG1_9GAST|nr:hypothetical protein PoB_007485700 [Plakobranchus ocellatus]